MTVHLEALELWEAGEEDYEVTPLGDNPIMNQMKLHKENKTRKDKAKSCLLSTSAEYASDESDSRILNEENERIRNYADQLLDLANKVRLFGKDFTDERIVQKILVTILEKYEATISSLENSKDIPSVTLAELVKALQALEQRRLMRKEDSVEGHVERVCKSQPQQEEAKAAVNQYQEEQLLVATCFASKSVSESWIIDSGCTNHMTSDQELFKDLDRPFISKVKIRNGESLNARGIM
ncbi:hypothetical protein KY284_032474 [Solanum tuberosum]|nr:hypothetical protein KY284_032474 [Solanum tuberosum]